MTPGTCPSITTVSTGGVEVAFNANVTNTLYLYGTTGTGNTGYGLATGTIPGIIGLQPDLLGLRRRTASPAAP